MTYRQRYEDLEIRSAEGLIGTPYESKEQLIDNRYNQSIGNSADQVQRR